MLVYLCTDEGTKKEYVRGQVGKQVVGKVIAGVRGGDARDEAGSDEEPLSSHGGPRSRREADRNERTKLSIDASR